MITTLTEFELYWSRERESTLRLLAELTDKSLSQAVAPQDRTLGRIAWHLALTIPEMMGRTGLNVAGPGEKDPVPASAAAIYSAYTTASQSLVDQIKAHWSDATLLVEDDMYGERWMRGATLLALITHQTHHRAQMTVLMRQAGLKVPGVYGPSREEWAVHGIPPPEV